MVSTQAQVDSPRAETTRKEIDKEATKAGYD